MYQTIFKPAIDRSVALILFVALLPIFLLVALAVRIFLGSPILFRQERPTKHAKIFTIYKFRTMSNETDNSGKLLSDKDRLGKVGKIIRSTSLDELPQLINIIKGDMSFVGPRPLLVEYLPRYNARQATRHNVKAGITGLAQINGRNALDWQSRLKLDAIYAEKISFWLDLKILFFTIKKVLVREGISANGSATVEKFLGNYDRIYIYGNGGHGRVVADCAIRSGFRVEGYIDDDPKKGIDLMSFLQKASDEHFGVALGIGSNATRKHIASKLKEVGVHIVTIIDPSAVIGSKVQIGSGTVIFANCVINTGATIGDGAIINSAAVVEHDCTIGSFAHLAPSVAVAGDCSVGELAFLGIGSKVINDTTIGARATIGAGAVVTADICANVTAVGIPARTIKEKL